MPLDKRKLLGPLFSPLSKAKHSATSRALVATWWLPSQLLRARRNRPYFAVNLTMHNGLGATLADALLCCHYAERSGLIPRITSTNRLYAHRPGEDFLDRYLGPPGEQPLHKKLRPMHFITLFSFYHLDFPHHVDLQDAHRMFWKYFAPKQVLTDITRRILASVPGAKFDLSVHYRGTDKALEAPLIEFGTYENAIHAHREAGGLLQWVFLATDDNRFEAFIRGRFPSTQFITFNLGQPSDAARGRHFSDMSAGDKALEALVNILLLAEAPSCIRGASYLSGLSKIVNPALRTVSLNRTYSDSGDSAVFPEREILAAERAERRAQVSAR